MRRLPSDWFWALLAVAVLGCGGGDVSNANDQSDASATTGSGDLPPSADPDVRAPTRPPVDDQEPGLPPSSPPPVVAQCDSVSAMAMFEGEPVWTPNHSEACLGGTSPKCSDAADWACIQNNCELGGVLVACLDASFGACRLSGPCAPQVSGFMCCMEEHCPPWPSGHCGYQPAECDEVLWSAHSCLDQTGDDCQQRAWEACRATTCDDRLCENGGVCDERGDCACQPGYDGLACERRQRYATYPIPSPPQVGLPHPMSYQDSDDVSLDLVTGLMWQRGSSTIQGRDAAVSSCESLELAGFDDWRMPNLVELLTLADSSKDAGIDTLRFPSELGVFWSASYRPNHLRPIHFSYREHAWWMSFGETAGLRCVRDTRAMSFDEPPPSHWYMKDGSVVDPFTGLQWTPSLVSVGPADEQRRACNSVRLGGHADWRLPRLAELATILDENAVDQATTPSAPFESLPQPLVLMTSEQVPAGAAPSLHGDLTLEPDRPFAPLRYNVGALCVRDAGSPGIKVECDAAAPTGFCLVSPPPGLDTKSVSMQGSDVVAPLDRTGTGHKSVGFLLGAPDHQWQVEAFGGSSAPLQVGTFNYPSLHYAPHTAGLGVYGCDANSSGTLTISELEFDEDWNVRRFAARFAYQCSENGPLSYGAINYNASGMADSLAREGATIRWQGSTSRLTYDRQGHRAYGFDTANQRIISLDLATNQVAYAEVSAPPLGGCVNSAMRRLFVVNEGSSTISEYSLESLASESLADETQAPRLTPQREIGWEPTRPDAAQVHCTPDGLLLVDGWDDFNLWSVEGLRSEFPMVTNHSADASGVIRMAVDSTGSDLYLARGETWYAVSRVSTGELSTVLDQSMAIDNGQRDVYMPILLDEARGLLFTQNVALLTAHLQRSVFAFAGEWETVLALDSERGRVATQYQVYAVDGYRRLEPTIVSGADQEFFDRDGTLRFLLAEQGELRAQMLE